MLMRRYRPLLAELADMPVPELPTRFGRLFDDFLAPTATEKALWAPAVDLVEKEDELLLTAELPGLKKDQVQLDISEGVLTLKGEKKEEKEEKNARYRVWERSYGSFERSFTLPPAINAENIKAEFDDGVLTVHLPKKPQAMGRRIEIGAK